jgi:hypothetical protein
MTYFLALFLKRRHIIKEIVFLCYFFITLAIYSQEEPNYIEKNMNDII